MSDASEDRISAAQIRLRMRHPFFATLALFATIRIGEQVETAATDGKSIWFNPGFLASLSDVETDGLLTHEILHAALLHPLRRGTRQAELWNIACDIVVNGMIREAGGVELPRGAIERPKLAHLSAEEIYNRLLAMKKPPKLQLHDLMEIADHDSNPNSEREQAELEGHWRMARDQARIVVDKLVASGKYQGSQPWGSSRDWQRVGQPEVDWRTVLWRYLVRTPVDYTGFDRRFIGQGLYLEALDGESVDVAVAIDTSGSIGGGELNQFLAEISGILSSSPHIRCQLFFIDAELYGPYDIQSIEDAPRPEGGGGTSFVPFFEWLDQHQSNSTLAGGERLAIYLTDGYGDFPKQPDYPVLWVVTADGLDADEFPFGQVARLNHSQ